MIKLNFSIIIDVKLHSNVQPEPERKVTIGCGRVEITQQIKLQKEIDVCLVLFLRSAVSATLNAER